MDYELFSELKWHVETKLEDKKNPKEVLKTLAALVDHVAELHFDEE